MLTDQDVQKIIEAEKGVFPTKQDFANFKEEMQKGFSESLTAVDGYAKKADSYFQEMLMLAKKVDRLEKWILRMAEKVGIQLID